MSCHLIYQVTVLAGALALALALVHVVLALALDVTRARAVPTVEREPPLAVAWKTSNKGCF